MPKKSRKNVGLIGLGIIGSRVANALRQGGFHVYVWNRTPRAAPNFLGSPRQVAELCDIIQIFVSDAQALFDVLDGFGDSLTSSHVILCNATIGPEATLDAAKLVQARGAQFLDAPFTGSKAAAETRELVYYVGGDDKTLQLAEPVLKASSKAIVKIGKIGDAAIVKVATNLISAVTVQTLAEAYAIIKGSGIPPTALADALKQHAVRSGVTDAKLAKMLDRNYEPHFSLKHMFKDVQLGIHIANSLDIDLPATTSTAGVMYGGLTRGWAEEDFSVLARAYQKEDEPPPLYIAAPSKPADIATAEITPPVESKAPAENPASPAPVVEKKEPARTSSPEELRDFGIKVPDSPAPEKPAAPVEAAQPVPQKPPEPAQAQSQMPAEAPSQMPSEAQPDKPAEAQSEKPAPEPAKPAEPAPAAGPAEKPPEPPKTANGAPGEAAAPHTPFVRIRRWFGSGTPN